MGDDKCLICGDERKDYPLKCKMCGMGIKNAYCSLRGFAFCSIKCRDAFARIMDATDKNTRKELIERDIIL